MEKVLNYFWIKFISVAGELLFWNIPLYATGKVSCR